MKSKLIIMKPQLRSLALLSIPFLIALMAEAAVVRTPIGEKVLKKDIFNQESSEGLFLDRWQWHQQVPLEKGIKLYRNPMQGAHKNSHGLLVLTSVTTNKESYMCAYMYKKKGNWGNLKCTEFCLCHILTFILHLSLQHQTLSFPWGF